MDDTKLARPSRVAGMELNILKIVNDYGPITLLASSQGPSPYSPALERLYDIYKTRPEQEQLAIVIDHLVDQKLIYPTSSGPGSIGGYGTATYLTADGKKRLDALHTPKRTWLKRNWFAVTIAVITALAALAGVVLTTIDLAVSAG